MSTVADDKRPPKGLKRLSLTPGARPLSRQNTLPNSPHDNSSSPSPTHSLSHGKRMASKRMSSIVYFTPSSPHSAQALRSPPPPIIPEAQIRESAPRSGALGLTRSPSHPRRHPSVLSGSGDDVRKVPPIITPAAVTLAEKHADLLTFIAQKESKCLELRDQLAQNETELLSLKKKWERIVSRASSSMSGSGNISSPESSSSISLPSVRSPPLYTTPEGVGEVVGAIRDGVQGLGRMLAMGGLASPGINSNPSPSNYSSPSSSRALPSSASNSRSSSLSSITITSPSSAGRSSLSSVTSLASSDTEEDKAPSHPGGGEERNGEGMPDVVHDFVTESATPSSPITPTSPPIRRSSSTIRPGHRKPLGTAIRTSIDEEPESEVKLERNLAERLSGKSHARLSSQSSWMPMNINKTWEELQRSETFTKSSKRASVLLSDMSSVSSSLFGSLSSALTPASPSPTQQKQTRTPSTPSSSGSSRPQIYVPLVNMESSFSPLSSSSSQRPSSLLDEDDEEENDEASSSGSGYLKPSLGAVLVPTPSSSSLSSVSRSGGESAGTRPSDSDEDELWNW